MNNQHNAFKKKIHVMQCRSTYTTGGGPDKTVLLIAEKANPEKFQIILMYMRGADDAQFQIGHWAREKGLTIHEVLEHGKLSFANLKEIHQLLQHYQIDILHTRDYKTAIVGYLLSFFNPKVKLLFTSHLWQDLDSLKMKVYTWLNLFALRKYHKVIAVSEDLRDFMIQRGVAAEKITVLHNAIDVDAWKRKNVPSTIREELQISPQSHVIGIVGRLRYEKDLPTTLRVAQKVIQELPDTYFLLVGDGPDRATLEQQVQDMGLTDKIRFLGFRKDTMKIYAGMDVFASTARIEGTPNTALEAMAMEVPVVYTRVGGVGEIIQDGYDGLLYEIGDAEGIAQGILSILTDNEKAVMLRENARQSVCQKFSFAKRLNAIETIYEELVYNE
jgi:glycosyltransferase involved in cell wall biosynthesis